MQVLTFGELSKRWKISRRSVERGISRGEFPKPMRIGGSLRFPLHAIEEFERRQSGDADPVEAEQDRFDAALAAVGDRLLSLDTPPGTSSWSRREASRYRDALANLSALDEAGLDKLAKLAHAHGVDSDRLELHFLAVRLHAESEPVAAELPARQAALSGLTQNCHVGLGMTDESILHEQQAARNAVSEAKDAARIVSYLGCIYPWLLGAAPSHVLEPRLGLIAPLLSRAAELGLKDELLASLTGETSDDATDEPDGTPAVPWWQCRKVPGAGGKSQPLQERAMTL